MKLIQLFGKSLFVACAAFALSFNVSCEKADDPAPAEDPAPAAAPADDAAAPAAEETKEG